MLKVDVLEDSKVRAIETPPSENLFPTNFPSPPKYCKNRILETADALENSKVRTIETPHSEKLVPRNFPSPKHIAKTGS